MSDAARNLLETLLADGGRLSDYDVEQLPGAFALATPEELKELLSSMYGTVLEFRAALDRVPPEVLWQLMRDLVANEQAENAAQVAWVAAHVAGAHQAPIPADVDAQLTFSAVADIFQEEDGASFIRGALGALGAARARALLERAADHIGAEMAAVSFFDGDPALLARAATSLRATIVAEGGALESIDPRLAPFVFAGVDHEELSNLVRSVSGTVFQFRVALDQVPLEAQWRIAGELAAEGHDSLAGQVAWAAARASATRKLPVPAEADAQLSFGALPDDLADDAQGTRVIRETLEWLGPARTRALLERAAEDLRQNSAAIAFFDGHPDLAARAITAPRVHVSDRARALGLLSDTDAEAALRALADAEPFAPESFGLIAHRPFASIVERAFARIAGSGPAAADALRYGLEALVQNEAMRELAHRPVVALLTRFPDEGFLREVVRDNLGEELFDAWSAEAAAALAFPDGFTFAGADRAALRGARRFVYRLADYDVNDKYTFTVSDHEDGLALRFELANICDEQVVFRRAALADARTFVNLSQGNMLSSSYESFEGPIEGDLPPFLLSRAVLGELRQGRASIASGGTDTVELGEPTRALRRLTIGEREHTVPVLVASGDDLTLVVVDDEEWPLVLHRAWGGDCYVTLDSFA